MFTEIDRGLPSVLERLVRDPGRWILVIEQGEGGRYLQFLALKGGTLVAEVSSNQFLSGDDEWTADDAARLVSFGWQQPEKAAGAPNYYRVSPKPSGVGAAAQLAITTLQDVFGMRPEDVLGVKLYESQSESTAA